MNQLGVQDVETFIDRIGMDKYVEHIDRIFGKYYPMSMLIGSGEPTDYPNFIEFCNHFLDQKNSMRVISNLEHVDRILQIKDKTRLEIEASFHLDSYLRNGKIPDDLIERYKKLYDSGVHIVNVITPLSPLVLANYSEYARLIQEISVYVDVICPIQMYHIYHGQEYPKSYTEQEAVMVKDILRKYGRKLQVEDVRDVSNTTFSKGKLCRVFDLVAMVSIDGDIWHCQSQPQIILGNIETYDGDVYTSPQPCSAEFCLCSAFYDSY